MELQGSTVGDSFICVHDNSGVCGGLIGTGGKFCLKSKDECLTVKHTREQFVDLIPGVYLRGPGLDAYCVPCVPIAKLGVEALTALLKESCDDMASARQRLDAINMSQEEKYESANDLDEVADVKPLPRFGTPIKKPLKGVNLRTKFDTLNVVDEDANINPSFSEGERQSKLLILMQEMVSTVESNRLDIEKLSDMMFESSSQIGIAPKIGAPNLWVGHLELKDDLVTLASDMKRKIDAGLVQGASEFQGKVAILERECKRLRTDVQLSFNEVAAEMHRNQAENIGSGRLSNPDPTTLTVVTDLQTRLELLEKFTAKLAQDDKPDKMAVRIGKYRFESIEDVGAWADKYLPPNYPFGPFVDAYSFLERVKSARDVGEFITAVSDMDTRRKSSLTADEAIVVEAFQHPLPRCFRGSSSSTTSHNAWLPAMKKKENWENKTSTRGVKIAIQDNMAGIRGRVGALITQRLGQHAVAEQLARELLSDTVSFLTALLSFISTTFLNLTDAGYPEDDAWNLVSKLVYRMFATDCYHDKRGIATELLDSDNHRSMAIGILWATFATHQIMREYMRHAFADHPSISGEYTRFLVANAGVSKMNKALNTISKLEDMVKALERKTELAEKKAATASNKADIASGKADEALKLGKKAKNQGT